MDKSIIFLKLKIIIKIYYIVEKKFYIFICRILKYIFVLLTALNMNYNV